MTGRLVAAVAVVAVAFSAAVFIHQRHTWSTTAAPTGNPFVDGDISNPFVGGGAPARVRHQPSWEDPVAMLVAIGGVAVALTLNDRPGRASRRSPRPAGMR